MPVHSGNYTAESAMVYPGVRRCDSGKLHVAGKNDRKRGGFCRIAYKTVWLRKIKEK